MKTTAILAIVVSSSLATCFAEAVTEKAAANSLTIRVTDTAGKV